MSIGPILLRFIGIATLAVSMAAPSLAVDGQTTIAFAENRIGMPPADFEPATSIRSWKRSAGKMHIAVSKYLQMNRHHKLGKATSEEMVCASLSYSCSRYL